MTPEQFCYWLQGFAELTATAPTVEQWQSVREHIATVFKKVTPTVNGPATAAPALPGASLTGPYENYRKIYEDAAKPLSPFGPYTITC